MSNDAIEALLAEASRLYNEGEYQRAIQKWEEALSLDPENQKAKESIKIASLLSDTWSEGSAEPEAGAPAAEPQSPQEVHLEEGLVRIRSKLEARDFQGAFADCEALSAAAGESEELKSLTDQARSGLEAEPFIKAALVRAQTELEAGNFETVEVLCSKVLSLDAANRDARNYLLMAQRRTTADAPQPGEAPAPAAAVPVSEPAEQPAPEALPPDPQPEQVAAAPAAVDSPAVPDEAVATEAPPSAPADAASDPLAALGMDLGGDLSPMDLAGSGGEEAAPAAPAPPQAPEPAAPVASDSAAPPEAPPVEVGQDIDAGEIESIPLGDAPPATRQGTDLIQDGSVYGGLETDEDAVAAPPGGFSEPGAPEAGGPAGGMPPAAAPRMPPPIPEPSADEFAEKRRSAPARRPPRPAARPARGGGGGLLRALGVIILLAGLGAGGWYVYQTYFLPVNPHSSASAPQPDVAAASGPSVPGDGEAAAGEESELDPAEEEAEETPPVEKPVVVTDEPKLPEDPAARTAMAQARYREGRRLVRSGKLRQAKKVLEAALQIDPMLFEAKDLYDEISQQLIEAKRFDQDIATVAQSMASNDYHSALWKLYRMQEAFPSVSGWNQNIASAWYNWGILLLKAGNLREAIDKFDEVLGVYPDDREAVRQRRVAERYLDRARDVSYHSYVDALEMRPFRPVKAPER